MFFNKPLVMCSAFSTVALLDRWARGKGEKWVSAIETFFERKQRQGVDGGRVFGETTFWHDRDDNPDNDHKFFNEDRATSIRMWNYQELVNGVRPKRLTVHNQKLILKLVEISRKHQFKIDYCTDATLKHSPGVGWKVIGQCIRQTAHFLNAIHSGKWDPKTMGHPTRPEVDEKIRWRFDNVKGKLNDLWVHETHNEEDAHSQGSWKRDGMDRAAALKEVNMQLTRHDRDEQWPAGNIGVSHGGNDSISYAVGPKGADVVRVHPSRAGDWSRVGNRFNHLNVYNSHIYLAETKHFIDNSMWYTIDEGWFRVGSSTKDASRILRFEKDALGKGYSFCRHSLVNMANGFWVDGDTLEEMALDRVELMTEGQEPPPEKWKEMDIRGIIDINESPSNVKGTIEFKEK